MRASHVDREKAVCRAPAGDHAGRRFEIQIRAAGFLGNKRGDATQAIAAGAGFRTVAVVDPNCRVGAAVRGIKSHELIVRLLPRSGARRGRLDRLWRAAQIDDDDLVAETVHLHEVPVRQSADIGSAHQ